MEFKLSSQYKPTGDQPQAIEQLVQGIRDGAPAQTLLGVTGSGKTFTMANVIQQVKKPTVSLKTFFPITRYNILFPTTIIISPRHIYLPLTNISRRTL